MAMYRVCPFCGANLDPCEQCDCKDKAVERKGKQQKVTPITYISQGQQKGARA